MMSPEIEREMVRRLRNGSIKLDHEGDIWHDDEKFTVKFMFEEGYGSAADRACCHAADREDGSVSKSPESQTQETIRQNPCLLVQGLYA